MRWLNELLNLASGPCEAFAWFIWVRWITVKRLFVVNTANYIDGLLLARRRQVRPRKWNFSPPTRQLKSNIFAIWSHVRYAYFISHFTSHFRIVFVVADNFTLPLKARTANQEGGFATWDHTIVVLFVKWLSKQRLFGGCSATNSKISGCRLNQARAGRQGT